VAVACCVAISPCSFYAVMPIRSVLPTSLVALLMSCSQLLCPRTYLLGPDFCSALAYLAPTSARLSPTRPRLLLGSRLLGSDFCSALAYSAPTSARLSPSLLGLSFTSSLLSRRLAHRVALVNRIYVRPKFLAVDTAAEQPLPRRIRLWPPSSRRTHDCCRLARRTTVGLCSTVVFIAQHTFPAAHYLLCAVPVVLQPWGGMRPALL
jgi:hypothetical protein